VTDRAPARSTLEAWRARGANRLDPVRFHFLEALAARAESYRGETRRRLHERLSVLLEAYAGALENPTDGKDDDHAAAPLGPGREALGELLGQLARHAAQRGGDAAPGGDACRPDAAFPALAALDDFQQLWSRVRCESQLRQSLAPAPAHAGPLNSEALVHRSLARMHALSPGYLRHFLAYVDALAWLEQMHGHGLPAGRDAPAAPASRRRPGDKPRKRRE